MSTGVAPSERIGNYRILWCLGKGGLGEVFLAIREGSSAPVALKRLRPEALVHPSAIPRFKREAHLVSMIDHPNVARLLDAGQIDDDFVIATEYVPGKDLEALLHHAAKSKVPIPCALTIPVILSVLDALIAIHALADAEGNPVRLVHRDLAPKNLMVGFDGKTKLIDFGIARGNVDEFRTTAGALIGTPSHLSPEQAGGETIDERSDLYTIAVVLHELLTSRRLVPASSVYGAVMKVLVEAAPAPSQLDPRAPPVLDPIVARGLEKDRERRWQNAREFKDALSQAARGMELWDAPRIGSFLRDTFPEDAALAARLGDELQMEEPIAEPTRAELRSSPSSQQPRPSLSLGIWSLFGLALAAALLLFVANQSREERAPPIPRPPAPVVETPQVEARPHEETNPVEETAPPEKNPPRSNTPRPSTPRPQPKRPPSEKLAAPAPADELTQTMAKLKASLSTGEFDISAADAFVALLEQNAESDEAKDAVMRARTCMTTCPSGREKVDSLARALGAVRAFRR